MTLFGVMLVPAAAAAVVCCVAACPAEPAVVCPKARAPPTNTVSAHDQVKEILKSLLIVFSTFLV
jgi:hypothetical protein